MSNTNSTVVTSSPQGASAMEVVEAIEDGPDEWLHKDNQVIATHPVGDTEADKICRAFEDHQFPDGTPLSNAGGLANDPRTDEVIGDYLAAPDDWTVCASQKIDPWVRIYSTYGDSVTSDKSARQDAVDHLKDELHIKSLEDSTEIVRYNDEKGIYEDDAEQVVKQRLESNLREHNTSSEARQIVHKLQSQKAVGDDAFNPEGKVCVVNGVLDVSDPSVPKVEEHSPEHRFRERLSVEFDRDADAPRFEQFIEDRVATDDVEKLQEFVGYTVCHPWAMPYQKALMLVGPTATGKSTFLNVLASLLGEENVSHLSIQQLTNAEFALAQADGTFANINNDLDAKKLKNTGRFKQIAAGEPVEANQKNKPYRTVRMTQKQLYAANRVPEVEGEDDAFYRRWLHVRFPETIPEDQRKAGFEESLKDELPGILNWALNGYARLMKNGEFTNELSLDEKRNRWKEYGNSVDRFVGERAEFVVDSKLPKDKVYSAYTEFCKESGLRPKPKNSFSEFLTRDYSVETARPMIHGERRRCFVGLNLSGVDEDEHAQQDASDRSCGKFMSD